MSTFSSASPARALIADHPLVRLGIRVALEEEETVEVCAEADTAEEAVTLVAQAHPDVCFIGWDIPGGGIVAVRGIFRAAPEAAVVVMASTSNVDDLLAALRAGAIGYVPGDTSTEGLRRVVRAVLAHEAAVPRAMVRDIVLELRASTPSKGRVTDREAQVLSMLRRGRSTNEIAQRLRISPVTVRRHISDLVHKLEVVDRSALRESEEHGASPAQEEGDW